MSIIVPSATVGKNKNIILKITNWTLASTVTSVTSLTAHTITKTKIGGNHSNSGSRFSQKQDLLTSPQTTTCLTWGTWLLKEISWVVSSRHLSRAPLQTYLSRHWCSQTPHNWPHPLTLWTVLQRKVSLLPQESTSSCNKFNQLKVKRNSSSKCNSSTSKISRPCKINNNYSNSSNSKTSTLMLLSLSLNLQLAPIW